MGEVEEEPMKSSNDIQSLEQEQGECSSGSELADGQTLKKISQIKHLVKRLLPINLQTSFIGPC